MGFTSLRLALLRLQGFAEGLSPVEYHRLEGPNARAETANSELSHLRSILDNYDYLE